MYICIYLYHEFICTNIIYTNFMYSYMCVYNMNIYIYICVCARIYVMNLKW